MLDLKNINFTVAKETKLKRQIFKNLNLRVKAGEFLVVIGTNGSGKSTLFNLITGFAKPDFGKILLNGKDITAKKQFEIAKDVSLVMQDPRMGTMESWTIFENMVFAINRANRMSLSPFASEKRKELVAQKLAVLDIGLEKRLDEIVANLSGGQRQALSLVMAIMSNSKLLLLDEITAALDPQAAVNIMKLANRIIRDDKRTSILITHNMEDAIKYGDRLVILQNGNFVKEFTAQEKKSLTTNKLVSELNLN